MRGTIIPNQVEQQKHELLAGQRQLREAQRSFDLAVQAAQREGSSTTIHMPDGLAMARSTTDEQSLPPPPLQVWPAAAHSPPSPPAPARNSLGSSRQHPMHVSTENSDGSDGSNNSWGPESTMSRHNFSHPDRSSGADAAFQPSLMARGDALLPRSSLGTHKPQIARQSQVVMEQHLFLLDIGAI